MQGRGYILGHYNAAIRHTRIEVSTGTLNERKVIPGLQFLKRGLTNGGKLHQS